MPLRLLYNDKSWGYMLHKKSIEPMRTYKKKKPSEHNQNIQGKTSSEQIYSFPVQQKQSPQRTSPQLQLGKIKINQKFC